MPNLTQQSADVRFRELDLSQVIASNSASNAAIVLVSKKGRLSRFRVSSVKEFNTEYGLPEASVSFGHYCGLDFLKEGDSLQVVRVPGAGYKYSALSLTSNAGVTSLNSIGAGIPDPENIDWNVAVPSGSPVLLFYPTSGPGSYANTLAIEIRSENLATPVAPTITTATTGGTLAAATYSYQISAISEIGEHPASPVATVVSTGAASANTVTWTPVYGARGYYVYGRVGGSVRRIATLGSDATSFVDTGTVTPDADFVPIALNAGPTPATTFSVLVYDDAINSSIPQETFICSLQDTTDGNGVQIEATQLINPYSNLVSVASYVPLMVGAVPTVYACAKTPLTGGDSGAAPTNGAIALAWTDNFEDTEQVKVNILINAGYTDVTVQQTMIRLAETRGDAFAILDTPSAKQRTKDAIAYRQLILNANTSYAAIYTSDVLESDVYSGKKLYIPISGWVAAIYARTDRVAGTNFAPAGLNRGLISVLGLRYKYSNADRNQLFDAQVNYARNFVGEGNAIFEQVTLQSKTSALSWVNVRRMVNVIKTSVHDFLMYSVHEPNDEFTRKAIVRATSDYLQSWKDSRGLLDYSVISDDTNNPPAIYNLGILKVTIFITPIIAVHEIQVDMVITKAGLAFSEINLSNL